MYNPLEYWNNRLQTHGTINTSATRISQIEKDFCEFYISEKATVLDFGCGDGRLFDVYEQKKCDVVGYDIVDLSKIINKKLENYTFEWSYIVGKEIKPLKFYENSFDIVACINVLIHILPSDIEMIISDIARIGKNAIFSVWENVENREIRMDSHCFNHNYRAIFENLGIEIQFYSNINNISLIAI